MIWVRGILHLSESAEKKNRNCAVWNKMRNISHDIFWSTKSTGVLPQGWSRWFGGRVEPLDVSAKGINYNNCMWEPYIGWEWTNSIDCAAPIRVIGAAEDRPNRGALLPLATVSYICNLVGSNVVWSLAHLGHKSLDIFSGWYDFNKFRIFWTPQRT